MESNGIGNNDAATLALLGGGGYGGIGVSGRGGYGIGSEVLAAGALSDGTALKTAIDCNASSAAASLDRISAQNLETRTVLKMDEITKGITDSEFRNLDGQRDLEKQITAGIAAQALCCCEAKLEAQKNACDTQKLIITEGNETRALILAVEARGNLDKLSEARSENNFLKIAALHPRP